MTREKALEAALRDALQYFPTGIVECRGDKCREPWCASCYGDEAAEAGLAVAKAAFAKATAALATPATAQGGTLCDRVWFDGAGEWFTAEEVKRHGTDGLREFVAVDSLPATEQGVDVEKALTEHLWEMNWSGDEPSFRRKARSVLDFLRRLTPPAPEARDE
jgi:hypothetical protein